jgi:hypothetical protein
VLRETSRQSPVYLLIPSTGTDSYGDPLPSWDNPTRVEIPGAELQRNATEDKDVNSGTQTERLGKMIATGRGPEMLVYSMVNENSRIEQDGKVWRVTGEPNIKQGLINGNTHLTASLTRTTVEAPSGF